MRPKKLRLTISICLAYFITPTQQTFGQRPTTSPDSTTQSVEAETSQRFSKGLCFGHALTFTELTNFLQSPSQHRFGIYNPPNTTPFRDRTRQLYDQSGVTPLSYNPEILGKREGQLLLESISLHERVTQAYLPEINRIQNNPIFNSQNSPHWWPLIDGSTQRRGQNLQVLNYLEQMLTENELPQIIGIRFPTATGHAVVITDLKRVSDSEKNKKDYIELTIADCRNPNSMNLEIEQRELEYIRINADNGKIIQYTEAQDHEIPELNETLLEVFFENTQDLPKPGTIQLKPGIDRPDSVNTSEQPPESVPHSN